MLSYAAYDVLHCGEHGDDAPKPFGLEGLSPGATNVERVGIVGEVLADLHERGLAVGDDPVAPLLETVRLLHNPHRRIYGWYVNKDASGVEVPGSFHLAESDDLAILARMEGGEVALEPVPWDELHTAIADLLPDTAAAEVAPITVPATRPPDPEEPEGWLEAMQATDQRSPVQRDHDRIRELTAEADLHFAMQVMTAAKDARARETTCEFPLTYYAGERGALLTVHKRPDGEGEPQLHMAPADRGTFRQELAAL